MVHLDIHANSVMNCLAMIRKGKTMSRYLWRLSDIFKIVVEPRALKWVTPMITLRLKLLVDYPTDWRVHFTRTNTHWSHGRGQARHLENIPLIFWPSKLDIRPFLQELFIIFNFILIWRHLIPSLTIRYMLKETKWIKRK